LKACSSFTVFFSSNLIPITYTHLGIENIHLLKHITQLVYLTHVEFVICRDVTWYNPTRFVSYWPYVCYCRQCLHPRPILQCKFL